MGKTKLRLTGVLKTFTCTILDAHLEWAIDLPNWSHASPAFDQYGDGRLYRNIHFAAKNRTEAARALDRCGVVTRNLSEGR